jgi:stage II sporulation protein D
MLARVAILLISVALTGVWVAKRVHTADSPSPDPTIPYVSESPSVRDVRVLIGLGVSRTRIRAEGGIHVVGGDGKPPVFSGAKRVSIEPCRDRAGVWIEPAEVCLPEITVAADRGDSQVELYDGGKWSEVETYPGKFRIIPGEQGLEVINLVDVERYTACVVGREIWPTFAPAAFRAQAIAARSFVLFQMQRRNRAAYDVLATQGSQVYRGVRGDDVGQRAERAARDSFGVVLTYHDGQQDRLFCTYYSAVCGGLSQSAAIFGDADDVPPLRGGVACDYCRNAPKGTYRWGPVRVKLTAISAKLAGAYAEVRAWGSIRDLTIVSQTAAGRPLTLRLHGDDGQVLDVGAERFRLLIGGSDIRSTDVHLRVERGDAVFDDGRGFGHGLGLCQWGMQGQAKEGRRAGDILSYYYPGAKLTRVY